MLAQDKRFKLVSSPNVRTRSGSSARISVGADVPTLGAANTTSAGGVVQSVQYQKTGVILELKPNVYRDVTELQLRQTLSEAASTDTGVNNSPTLLNREVSTTVTMKDGDAVILGGLSSTRTTDNERGQSWLPKFLRASTKEKASTELVVFLQLSRVKS